MKRILSVFLLLTLLCGCSRNISASNNVTFYYLQKEYTYGQSGCVFAPEEREQSSTRKDLAYLMSLYVMGPVEEEHRSPLPDGTRIECTEDNDGSIQLFLSDSANSLSNSDFSIACACLAMTCFDIMDTDKVTVVSDDRKITFFPDSFLLTDDITSYPITEELQ